MRRNKDLDCIRMYDFRFVMQLSQKQDGLDNLIGSELFHMWWIRNIEADVISFSIAKNAGECSDVEGPCLRYII